jgi:Glycosyl transferase family 2
MRKRAVFTIVQNEPVFLPLWLQYYSRYFDRSDIYVLDHDTSDASTEGIGSRCNLLSVHREKSFDHAWLRSTVAAFQVSLLQSYETVLFAEADEFVLADPRSYTGLDDYIERLPNQVGRCTGFEVVHYPDEEPSLRFDQPVLAQRRYWHSSRWYCKPLLSTVPLSWSIGFHFDPAFPDLQPDPSLVLVHLHRVDYESCRARHRGTAARNWNEYDVQAGYGRQNRFVEGEAFDTWFFGGFDDGERELIPETIKNLL